MKKGRICVVLVSLLVLSACSVVNKSISRFADDRVKLGVRKSAFVSKFGRPYSQEAVYGPNKELRERLLYKEDLYLESWYLVTTAFLFEDSKLIKQEVLKEERMYPPSSETNGSGSSRN